MADLARFARAFLNAGKLDGQDVLPSAVITRMTTPVAPVHSQVEGGRYGYGLIMLEDRGVKLIEHGGTLGGSATDFVLAPDRPVEIVATDEGIGMKTGSPVLPLTRIAKDAFLVSLPGFTDPIRVEFVRGADGRVAFLHNRLRALKRMPTEAAN